MANAVKCVMKEGRMINNKASRFQSSNARNFFKFDIIKICIVTYGYHLGDVLTALNQLKQSPDHTRKFKPLSWGSCMSFQQFDIISTVAKSHRP